MFLEIYLLDLLFYLIYKVLLQKSLSSQEVCFCTTSHKKFVFVEVCTKVFQISTENNAILLDEKKEYPFLIGQIRQSK